MRLDKYLKLTRILKRRTQAKELCDKGKIYIDNRHGKASSNVREGQIVKVNFGKREVTFEILKVPEGNIRKDEAETLYRIIKVLNKRGDDEI